MQQSNYEFRIGKTTRIVLLAISITSMGIRFYYLLSYLLSNYLIDNFPPIFSTKHSLFAFLKKIYKSHNRSKFRFFLIE